MPISDPQFIPVALSATGFGTLVPAVSGAAVRVTGYALSAANTVSLRFFAGTVAGLTGTILGAANGFYSPGESMLGHFQGPTGSALFGSISGNVNVHGHLTYVLVS